MSDDPVLARLREVTVGPVESRPVVLVEPDPLWPERYAAEAARIGAALGAHALELHHVGSTAVPGLIAKPVIAIVLVVADPADEAFYVPALEAAGYAPRIREPDWYEHRMLRPVDAADVNLHVFGPACPEVERMLRFRDLLRARPDERELYAQTKRQLAQRSWPTVQHYADAKSEVVAAILARG